MAHIIAETAVPLSYTPWVHHNGFADMLFVALALRMVHLHLGEFITF